MSEKCVLCRSSRTSVLFKREQYIMVRCKKCGLIYRLPQVKKNQYLKEIKKHYTEIDPSHRVAYSRNKLYERFLSRIERTKKKDSKLLDVGCGIGYFLFLARKHGYDAYGLELIPELVEAGIQNYGLDIRCADFEEANFPENYFDFITLWNVFDELPDPLSSIYKIKKILKPGAFLFMRMPNATFHLFAFKVQRMLKKICLNHLLPYQSSIFHIFSFSKKTLELELSRNDFSPIQIKNSRPTSEDPYAVGKAVRVLKIFAFLIAQFLFFLTWGKLTVAPSIEVFAENEKA
jgi:2-polyprenyl-3-methyl-5-hydroxy-6-metoxy-1,4-benzoquinol methylase